MNLIAHILNFKELSSLTLSLLIGLYGLQGSQFLAKEHPKAESSIPFEHVIIDGMAPENPHVKAVGDINGDGFSDVIAASSAGGPLSWYEYPHWDEHVIAEGQSWSTDAEVGDIDGDGDQDIVISEWYTQKRIEWYENPADFGNPASDAWTMHVVGKPRAHDIEIGDLDKDGDLDIVSRQQGNTGNVIELWQQESPTSWQHGSINSPVGEGLHLGDLDKDGDQDVIIGGSWFENTGDILNGTWTAHSFAVEFNHSAVIPWMADMNNDGRPDVVLTPSEPQGGTYRTVWFEAPEDPKTTGWAEHIIDGSVETVTHSLGVADMDNDGDLDVVTAEMHQSDGPDEVRLYINIDGIGGTWEKQIIDSSGSHNARIVDIGSDGDYDIVGANWSGSYQPLEMWENQISAAQMTISDDFNQCVLDSGLWTIVDPKGDGTVTVSDGKAMLSVPEGVNHVPWTTNQLVRIVQAASDVDFELEVKLDSPLNEQTQMQGLLVEQDPANYLLFEYHSTHPYTVIHAKSLSAGISDVKNTASISYIGVAPQYMKVTRKGNQWTQAYSFDGHNWTKAVSFVHALKVSSVGVYVGNYGGPAHTAVVDYFYNTATPGVGDVVDNTLNVEILGSGQVTKVPDQASYSCGAEVSLTASPDSTWGFEGWSGDINSDTNPLIITMDGQKTIAATFSLLTNQVYLPIILTSNK